MKNFEIHPDISLASTLPGCFYCSQEIYEKCKDAVFAPSWQLVADREVVNVPGQAYPFVLLEGFLNEPLLLTRDLQDRLHLLSNVCTHRGNLLVENPANGTMLRCRYHGRRFRLDGKFHSMPEFEGCKGFPSEKEDLLPIPFAVWGRWIFASLAPRVALEKWIQPMMERLSWIPVEEFRHDAAKSRDYLVKANWILYCDNYLEGFHIPYVHPTLNEAIDYGTYRTELLPYGVLQIAYADKGGNTFEIPPGHVDSGESVAAYYFWFFPNLMFNFYPWGLSINIVRPLSLELTKISYSTYIWDEAKLRSGAGAELDRVEREDQAIVEAVQIGVHSRFYDRGRYSPKREQGVHHFHRLLTSFL